MNLTVRKIILIALWFALITFPLVGIQMGDGTVTFRWGPLIIGLAVLIGGLLWLSFNRLKHLGTGQLGAGQIGRWLRQLTAPVKSLGTHLSVPRAVKVELSVIILSLIIIPLFLSGKYLNLGVDIGIYILLALGLNVVVGSAGLLVLGYAGLWAIGAYTYALASITINYPFWPGLLLAAVVTGFCGFLVGLPSLRLRGDYLAIVTLGFGELIRYLLKNLPNLTGGEKGLPSSLISGQIHHPQIGSWVLKDDIHYYYLTLLIVILAVILIERLNNSRVGRAWIAIREDELAATSMGINTTNMKIIAFVISAVIAGVAGVLYAAKMNYITPESFRFEQSALVLAMVILGGMGNTFGVILGAIILYLVPWLIRDQWPALQDYRLLIYGATMVIMMLFRPQGLISSKRRQVELTTEAQTS